MQNLALNNRRLLIAGASSGIGRACAILAAKQGATCVLTARRLEALEETRAMMERPETHLCVPADLSDAESIHPLMETAVQGGLLDGIVYATGVSPFISVSALTPEDIELTFQTNLFSFMEIVQLYSKRKFGKPGGSLVAISSTASLMGRTAGSLYCGSKGGMDAAIRVIALELASKKIRANAILPGFTDTPMVEKTRCAIGEDKFTKQLPRIQPLGIVRPEFIAETACFLLSDAAAQISGVTFPVDGGVLS